MGGKKKSLASRVSKMSDEQRQHYIQHKADQEEEQHRRREQLISLFLKYKLKRENAFARLNIAKLNEKWHQILRAIKCEELRSDVGYIKEHVDHTIKFKNRMINKLKTEINEVEEQYTNNFQSHRTYISKTNDFSKQALENIHREFDHHIVELHNGISIESIHIKYEMCEKETYLKTLKYLFCEQGKNELREHYDDYFKIFDNLRQNHKKELDGLRNEKERQITNLWLMIGKFLKQYVAATDTRRTNMVELSSLDTQNRHEIANYEKNLKANQAQFTKLEKYYETLRIQSAHKTRQLKEFVKKLKSDILRQKLTIHKKLHKDEQNLQLMSAWSNAAVVFLRKQHIEGVKLFQWVLICRKYETAAEKATQFTSSFNQVNEELLQSVASDEDTIEENILLTHSLGKLSEMSAHIKTMDGFWHRYNRVLINLMTMQLEKRRLLKSNEELRLQIQQQMELHIDKRMSSHVIGNLPTSNINLSQPNEQIKTRMAIHDQMNNVSGQ